MFIARLRERGHDPEAAQVTIMKAQVAGWLAEATREHYSTATATSHIKLLGINQLSERHSRTGGTWIWRGEQATSSDPVPINPSRPGESSFTEARAEWERSRPRRGEVPG